MYKHRKHETGKRVTAGAAALLASVSLVVGGLFRSPAELLDDPVDAYMSSVSDDAGDDLDGSGDGGEDSGAPEEKKRGFSARLRLRVLALPVGVRACVGVPLWCVGWLMISLGSALWGSFLSPVVSELVRLICIAGVMLLALAVGVKAAFPTLSLRRIFKRRTVCTLVLGVLIVGALDVVLGLTMSDNEPLARLISVAASGLVMLVAALPIFKRDSAPQKAETSPIVRPKEDISPELMTRRLAEQIADSYK